MTGSLSASSSIEVRVETCRVQKAVFVAKSPVGAYDAARRRTTPPEKSSFTCQDPDWLIEPVFGQECPYMKNPGLWAFG